MPLNDENQPDITLQETELDLLRKDLAHQLSIPDELDWDYFVEVAKKAKAAANKENHNMTLPK